VCVTWWIFERLSPAARYEPWLIDSVGAGTATVLLWMLALLPFHNWYRVFFHGWRALVFGLVAGSFAAMIASSASRLWDVFHQSTFYCVKQLLSVFSQNVVCQPERFLIGLDGFVVEISASCSGYDGIGLVWVFLGAFCWWFRHELRFPKALLLIPLGTVLSYSANIVRIAALIIVGASGYGDVAPGGFHSQAGWLAFNGIALGLVTLARRAPMFAKSDPRADPVPAGTFNPTAVYSGPLVAIAAATMVSSALSDGKFV
jgi:exosortase E/protease (VPEID-CTERM system)